MTLLTLLKLDNIGTTAGIIGAVFVALGNPLFANTIWAVSNPILILHNYKTNQYAQCRMFVVFAVISWFGVINLWN